MLRSMAVFSTIAQSDFRGLIEIDLDEGARCAGDSVQRVWWMGPCAARTEVPCRHAEAEHAERCHRRAHRVADGGHMCESVPGAQARARRSILAEGGMLEEPDGWVRTCFPHMALS